jgi:hypothetical protein
VFWATRDVASERSSILKAPKTGLPDGGVPITIGYGIAAGALAVKSDYVYWIEHLPKGSLIRRAPVATGRPDDLASSDGTALSLAVDATSIYWLDVAGNSGGLFGAPSAGIADAGTGQLLYASGAVLRFMAIDAMNVYFIDEIQNTIDRVPKTGLSGSGVPDVISAGANAWAVALDDKSIYWTTSADQWKTTTIMKAGLDAFGSGRGGTPVASGPGFIEDIAVDADGVYWTAYNSGMVLRAPLSGVPDGGAPTVLASDQTEAAFIAVDAESVYWTTKSAIAKVAK